ncbi:hypothetical protein HOY82DRAFT_540749 [Tuber indicum]|nr:hypothetical protein HOY82DRAFT_540749 [Tuber indicum]
MNITKSDMDELDMGFLPVFPDAIEIVQEGVAAGVLLRPRDNLEASDEESIDENAWMSPLIDNETALQYTNELGRYLQALPVTHLPLSVSHDYPVEDFIRYSHKLHSALLRYCDGRKTQQTTIHRFFKPFAPESIPTNRVGEQRPAQHNPKEDIDDRRVGRKDKGKGRETEKGCGGLPLNWDIEAEYLTTGNDTEEDEDHSTCVATRWKTKSVNAAYENLLK